MIAEFGEDTDPPAALVLGWLAGKRSVHTRRAYDRDIAGCSSGAVPGPGRAPVPSNGPARNIKADRPWAASSPGTSRQTQVPHGLVRRRPRRSGAEIVGLVPIRGRLQIGG